MVPCGLIFSNTGAKRNVNIAKGLQCSAKPNSEALFVLSKD